MVADCGNVGMTKHNRAVRCGRFAGSRPRSENFQDLGRDAKPHPSRTRSNHLSTSGSSSECKRTTLCRARATVRLRPPEVGRVRRVWLRTGASKQTQQRHDDTTVHHPSTASIPRVP